MTSLKPLPMTSLKPGQAAPHSQLSSSADAAAGAAARFEAMPEEERARRVLFHLSTYDRTKREVVSCAASLDRGPGAAPPDDKLLLLLGRLLHDTVLAPSLARRKAGGTSAPCTIEQLLSDAAEDDDALHKLLYAMLTGGADRSAALPGGEGASMGLAGSFVAAQALRAVARPKGGAAHGFDS